MKTFSLALGVLLALAVSAHAGNGRQVGTPTNPDAASWYGGGCYSGGAVTGCELAIDYTGDLVPTVANAQDLGTAALPFRTVYSVTVTNSGNETNGTVGATPIANTGGTAATQSTVLGLSVQSPVQVFGLVASSMVPVNSSLELVGANAATVTLTSQPEISTTTVIGGTTLLPFGTDLVITSTATGQNIVFTSSTSSNASGLVLGAATRTITKNKTLGLWLDNITVPAVWREKWYGNN